MKLQQYNERHCYVNFVDDNPFLFIEAAGVTEPDPRYRISYTRKMSMTILEYVQTGVGYVQYGGKIYRLSAGDFCIMRAGIDNFCYYSDKDTPYRKLWFSGCGKFMDSILDLYDIPVDVTIINAPSVEPRFKQIIDELYRFGFIEQNIVSYLSELFWQLKRSEIVRPKPDPAAQIHAYIDFRYSKIDDLSDIAGLFRITERQLTRIFTEVYGITPWAYVIDCRLRAAAGMLVSTEMKISEISGACGYKSVWHFDREFAKKFGCSPSEYRKSHKPELQNNSDGTCFRR